MIRTFNEMTATQQREAIDAMAALEASYKPTEILERFGDRPGSYCLITARLELMRRREMEEDDPGVDRRRIAHAFASFPDPIGATDSRSS